MLWKILALCRHDAQALQFGRKAEFQSILSCGEELDFEHNEGNGLLGFVMFRFRVRVCVVYVLSKVFYMMKDQLINKIYNKFKRYLRGTVPFRCTYLFIVRGHR